MPRDSNGRFTFGERTPVLERFLSKIKVNEITECWEWTDSLNKRGYGRLGIGSTKDGSRRKILAHRFSYEWFIGPIPEGLEPDHLCRNSSCVNPDHLEIVTHLENSLRGIAGIVNSIRMTRVVCSKGHNDWYTAPSGERTCRVCRRERQKQYYWGNVEESRRHALEKLHRRKK